MEAFEPPNRRRTIVTLVDDDPCLLVPIAAAVRDEAGPAATVSHYVDPTKALEAVAICRPDLILLDLNMPELDGMTFFKLVKASRRLRRVPVVMLAAQSDWSRVGVALEAGADDYVFKPFEHDTLVKVIRAGLERHASKPGSHGD